MGYWGTVDHAHGSVDNLLLYPCPPGYCRCEISDMSGHDVCINIFNSAQSGSDSQCSCDREGSHVDYWMYTVTNCLVLKVNYVEDAEVEKVLVLYLTDVQLAVMRQCSSF